VFDVHDYVKSKLYELYENDGLFDKFECCFSPNSTYPIKLIFTLFLYAKDIFLPALIRIILPFLTPPPRM
jgi:hypothetical protein